jgi:DNA-binding beta-propeller fold protein YncE
MERKAFDVAPVTRDRKRLKKGVVCIVIMALFAVQSAAAATYPITIPFGRSWPYSIVVDSSRGLVYFDAASGDYPPTGFLLGVVNATSHSLVATLPLNETPGAMALDQATGRVYVAGNESIEVFSRTGAIGEINTPGHQLLGMAHDGRVSPDIFFTSGDGVFAIDPRTSDLVGNATVANGPEGLALDPANGMLYVSEYLSGQIAVLSASTMRQVGTVALPSCCAYLMSLNPKTEKLYASTRTNQVDIVNLATEEFEKSVQVAASALNSTGPIAVDNETGRVYVASSPGGSILELDSGGAIVGRFEVQSQVAGLAVDTKTRELYATDYHQVTVFSAAKARGFLLILLAGAGVVGIAAIAVYILIRRRDERERMRAGSGRALGPSGET